MELRSSRTTLAARPCKASRFRLQYTPLTYESKKRRTIPLKNKKIKFYLSVVILDYLIGSVFLYISYKEYLMKNYLRIGLALLFTTCTGAILADDACCGCSSSSTSTCCGGENGCNAYGTVLIPRSLGDRLDWQNHFFNYKFDEDCLYGNFSINYEYMRSFRGERMAQYLFGSQSLHFVGSQATATREATDLLADNFGLAVDTDATITFCPRIQNHIVDFQLYVGLNELCDGLFFQVNLPLVHSKWNLNDDCNCCCGAGSSTPCATLSTTPFVAGYMASTAVSVTPNTTFLQALSGTKVGDMAQDWGYGKFFGCDCDETKLAAVNFDLGYNFYECEDYHVGAFVRVVAPTGTELDEDHASCVFKPVIGDDHWKLGAGLDAHARLYSCDDEAHTLDMYLSGYAVHLFEREQVRSFDLNSGRLSRYMLLKEFDSNNVYTGNLYNAIDYTTRRAKVKVAVQGEGLIGLLYKNECGLRAGLGYNIYGKSQEDICGLCNSCNSTIASKNLGIKGCTPVRGQVFTYNGTVLTAAQAGTPPANVYYALGSTQSDATAYACGAVDHSQQLVVAATGTTGTVVLDQYNHPSTTVYDNTHIGVTSSSTAITGFDANFQPTGLTLAPVLLTDADINICSGRVPSQVTHRIFGHLDYEWTDCDWSPMLRLGGEVELASCSDKGAVNMWGVMIQGSVSF